MFRTVALALSMPRRVALCQDVVTMPLCHYLSPTDQVTVPARYVHNDAASQLQL